MRQALLKALAKVDRPSEVFASGDLPLTLPGLVVEGVGLLRLPLGATQARKLIQRCRQAPYGRGAQTLVDTAVRRVWEMDSEQVSFTNTKWQPLIDAIVSEIQQKLGLETRQLVANLYKLLIYEKGSFFLSHRDGEKLDGMVATLVVSLQSIHTGGELVVSHNGHRHVCDFPGAASGNELSFAAFYADCEHEVQPLASGYRLCLTYNLTLAKSRRRHLHDMIDRHGCDLTHVTERRGRPFTLVCTKTIASYERALAVYHRNVDNLARIVDIEKRMVK